MDGLDRTAVIAVDGRLVSAAAADGAVAAARQAVRAFHETQPQKPGLPLEAFRRAAGTDALADHARAVLQDEDAVVVESYAPERNEASIKVRCR